MSSTLLPAPELAPVSTGNQRTILLVDDDTDQTDILAQRLGKIGYRTIEAHTGVEGLSKAREESPDLIVLDVRLPDLSGFEICQQLGDDPATNLIPVIMLSGMERPDIVRTARSVGSQFYVRKPYDPNALLILIKTAIDEADSWSL